MKKLLFLTLLVASPLAAQKVNPGTQITWPTCTAGQVYAPATNTCITPSGTATPAAPAYSVQLANSGVTGLAADPNITINTTTHTLSTPNLLSNVLKNAATNYPFDPTYGGNYIYVASQTPCNLSLLLNDNGAQYPSSVCNGVPFDINTYPGWDYGAPALGNAEVGWYGHNTYGSATAKGSQFYFSGIKGLYNQTFLSTSAGDINYFGTGEGANIKNAWIAGGDEGFHFLRANVNELSPYLATIATGGGGTGANALTLTCTSGCANMGLQNPVIDLTTGTKSGTASSVTAGSIAGTQQVTTSYAVVASTQGLLQGSVTVPRTVNNTTQQLSKATLTVTTSSTPPLIHLILNS